LGKTLIEKERLSGCSRGCRLSAVRQARRAAAAVIALTVSTMRQITAAAFDPAEADVALTIDALAGFTRWRRRPSWPRAWRDCRKHLVGWLSIEPATASSPALVSHRFALCLRFACALPALCLRRGPDGET